MPELPPEPESSDEFRPHETERPESVSEAYTETTNYLIDKTIRDLIIPKDVLDKVVSVMQSPSRPIDIALNRTPTPYRPKRLDLVPSVNVLVDLILKESNSDILSLTPEKEEDEPAQAYVRRLFSLQPDEEQQLLDELETRRLELINNHFGNPEAITRVNREIEFQKWRFTGKPGDALPQAIRCSRRNLTIDMSFNSGTQDIVDKYREKISERTLFYSLGGLTVDTQHQTRAYTFLNGFLNPVESTALEDRPLLNITRLALEKEAKQRIAREHGTGEDELDMPKSSAGAAAQQRYRKSLYTLDLATEQRKVTTTKESDPMTRLRDFARKEIAAEQKALGGVEIDPASITKPNHYSALFAQDKATGAPVILGLATDRFLARYCDRFGGVPDVARKFYDVVEGALIGDIQRETRSFESRLAAFDGFALSAASLYSSTDSGRSSLEQLMWMREPAFDEDELKNREYEPYMPNQPGLTREEYDELREQKIAAVMNDNRNEEEKARHQLVQLGNAYEVPEHAGVPITFSLRFGKSDTGQDYFPDKYFPDARGFTVVAKRKTDAGTEFDFVSTGENVLRTCEVSCMSPANTNLSPRLRLRSLDVIDRVVGDNDNLTITEFQNIFVNNSIYLLPESNGYSYATVENGMLMTQCDGGSELFAELCDGIAPGVTARKIGGMVICPGEDFISRAGHAQTEIIVEGESYICDATPRLSLEQMTSHLSTDTLLGMIATIQRVAAASPQPPNSADKDVQTSQDTQRSSDPSPPKDFVLLPEEEKADPRELAQKEIDDNARIMQAIKHEFEGALRVRLGVEDDLALRTPDALYKYLLKLVPNAEDPLRMASRVVIGAANNMIDASVIEVRQKRCAEVLEKIAFFKQRETAKRQKVSKVADTNTLASLDASVRAVSAQYDRMARAYAVLRTDDAGQRS